MISPVYNMSLSVAKVHSSTATAVKEDVALQRRRCLYVREGGQIWHFSHLIIICRVLAELAPLGGSAGHSCTYNATDCQDAMQAAGCAENVDLNALVLPLDVFSDNGHSILCEHLKDIFGPRVLTLS